MLDPVSSAPVEKTEPEMMFLEQEYLAFCLGNPNLSTDMDSSDIDTDTDSLCSSYAEYISDSEDESTSSDLISTDNDDSRSDSTSEKPGSNKRLQGDQPNVRAPM